MDTKNKKEGKKLYKRWWFWAVVVFLLFVIATADNNNLESEPVAKDIIKDEQTNTQVLSEKDQIKQIVSNELKGDNNMQKPFLRKVDVLEHKDGGWAVIVDYNAADNLSTKYIRQGIEMKMSDIYKALYTSGKNVTMVSVAAFLPSTDKYGNQNEAIVYESALDKEVANKVNWDIDSATLRLSVLPGLWNNTFLHPEFR